MSDLYEFTGEGNCNRCDESILWFRTPAGKNMPVNDGGTDIPMLDRGDTLTREEGRTKLLPNVHPRDCCE